MPPASISEDRKQAVINLLDHISTSNGYNNNISSKTEFWRPINNIGSDQIPALYITNGAEEGNLEKNQKFSARCLVDEQFDIEIIGIVEAQVESDIPERLVNYLLEDCKRAISRDMLLGDLADAIVEWKVRKPEPWKLKGKRYSFQLTVTYQARASY